MTSYFITGTDTGCGKTYVTCLLIDYFKRQRINCIGLKPIASGCEWRDGALVNEDIEYIMSANQSNININNWIFEAPVSPHFVAADQGIQIKAKDIAEFCYNDPYNDYQIKLIEGAGGLMVPLNETETWIDFVKLTKIPMILVIGIRLGCINHALQLNEVILAHKLPVVGWVANEVDDRTDRINDIILAIESRIEIPCLAKIRHFDDHLTMSSEMESLLCYR